MSHRPSGVTKYSQPNEQVREEGLREGNRNGSNSSCSLEELRRCQALVCQLEKSVHWWADCTAKWREKWCHANAEKSKVVHEKRLLKQRVDQLTKELEQLRSESVLKKEGGQQEDLVHEVKQNRDENERRRPNEICMENMREMGRKEESIENVSWEPDGSKDWVVNNREKENRGNSLRLGVQETDCRSESERMGNEVELKLIRVSEDKANLWVKERLQMTDHQEQDLSREWKNKTKCQEPEIMEKALIEETHRLWNADPKITVMENGSESDSKLTTEDTGINFPERHISTERVEELESLLQDTMRALLKEKEQCSAQRKYIASLQSEVRKWAARFQGLQNTLTVPSKEMTESGLEKGETEFQEEGNAVSTASPLWNN
ncbi:coiled-coil domain-containing protein 102A-like [Erpetoichthys calabaricus]|uniref:coiled-coil domain-containing protein 102A-like n=1 Tax=Erpetoichthys calabaricus TaxID=27687 RepID=UPI0010A0A45E|nr:coiled-coil domain-containing protein 102A-like [Erpetoichthys calabaricus]